MRKVTFDETKMDFYEKQALREKYRLGASSYQRIEEYYRADKLVAVTIASSKKNYPHTILTSRGEFYRTHANDAIVKWLLQ